MTNWEGLCGWSLIIHDSCVGRKVGLFLGHFEGHSEIGSLSLAERAQRMGRGDNCDRFLTPLSMMADDGAIRPGGHRKQGKDYGND